MPYRVRVLGALIACIFAEVGCGARSLVPLTGNKPNVSVGQAVVENVAPDHALAAQSASFGIITVSGAPFLVLKISDQANDCDLLAHNARHKNSGSLILALYKLDSDGRAADPQPGSYVVESSDGAFDGPGGFGTAEFSKIDGACTQSLGDDVSSAVAGQIVITSVRPSAVTGSFNLKVGTQASAVSGTFQAVQCAALGATAAPPVHQCL